MQPIENILNVEFKSIDYLSQKPKERRKTVPVAESVSKEEKIEVWRIDPVTQMIIHPVGPKDTLQGIAFKYGVTVCLLCSYFFTNGIDDRFEKREQISYHEQSLFTKRNLSSYHKNSTFQDNRDKNSSARKRKLSSSTIIRTIFRTNKLQR
jgi:hypothetical protein